MSTTSSQTASAAETLDRLTTKGTRILDLCLELRKDLCVKGFIDAQIERGEEYYAVVAAMRDYIDVELGRAADKQRRELLTGLRRYIDKQLEAVDYPARAVESQD